VIGRVKAGHLVREVAAAFQVSVVSCGEVVTMLPGDGECGGEADGQPDGAIVDWRAGVAALSD